MLQKLPTSLKAVLFSFCLTSSYAADISFSGETEVCPGTDYTYTASASNAFGARKGAFEWTFWRDNQIIGSFGAPIVDCPANPGISTSTVTFNWGTILGSVKIRVRFKGVNDPLCQFNSPDVKWVDVNVRVISPGPISGLVFCSPNETRTLSVPGILPFNSAQSCYFHHKYDWIVPSGWSAIPTGGQPFTSIEGGIRTFATSVLVTAPSQLAPRYDGNYNIIVRTEPAWPYPTESTGKIWVGIPNLTSLTYDGQLTSNSCSNGLYQSFTGGDHVLSATGSGTDNYPAFILNSFGSPYVHGDANGNNFNFNVNSKFVNAFEFTISSNISNACGTTASCTYFTNWATFTSPFPNPSDNEFMLQLGNEGSLKTISLYNVRQEQVFLTSTTEKELIIETGLLQSGFYVVKIVSNDRMATYHLQIRH